MKQPLSTPATLRVVNLLPTALVIIGLLLLLNFFAQVRTPLLSVILAVLLATALNPAVVFFERWLPRGPAAVLTVLLALGTLLGLTWLAVPPIVSQLTDLLGGLPGDAAEVQQIITGWLDNAPGLAATLQQVDLSALARRAASWAGGLLSALVTVTGSVVSGLVTLVVTFIMLVFTLSNPAPLVRGVLGAVPAHARPRARQALAQILEQMGAWGRAEVLVMLIIGAGMATGLYLLGVENWLVFGVISALGELIPNIGPILAAVPPILFTLLDDPQKALYVAIFAIVLQQIEGNLVAPFVLGRAAEMHPLSVTVGVLLFGNVFGLVGALLTLPFLIVIKALYENFYLDRQPPVSERLTDDLIHGELAPGQEGRKEQQDTEEGSAPRPPHG